MDAPAPPTPPTPPVATQYSFGLPECDAVLSDHILDATMVSLGAAARMHKTNDVSIYEFDVGIATLVDAIEAALGYALVDTRALMMESVSASAPGVVVVVIHDIYTDRHVTINDARAYITIGDEWTFQVGWTPSRCIRDREFIRECIAAGSHITCVGVNTWMSPSMRACLLSRDLRDSTRVIAWVTISDCKKDRDDDDDSDDADPREDASEAVDITDVFPRSARIINCAPLTYDSPIILAVVNARGWPLPRLCVYSLCTDTMLTFRNWTHVRQSGREIVVCDDDMGMWLSAYHGVSHRGKYSAGHRACSEVIATAVEYK